MYNLVKKLYIPYTNDINEIARLECYAWKNKLKTGAYYTECSPEIIASTVAVESKNKQTEIFICNKENKECIACQ
jgi:hypothetical protein